MITNRLTIKQNKLDPKLSEEITKLNRHIGGLFGKISRNAQQLLKQLPPNYTEEELKSYNDAYNDLHENSEEAKEIKQLQLLGRIKIEELQSKFFNEYTNKQQVIDSCNDFINEVEKADFEEHLNKIKESFKRVSQYIHKEDITTEFYEKYFEDTQERCFEYLTSLNDYNLLIALCENKEVNTSEYLIEPLLNKIASFYPTQKPLTKAILNIFDEEKPRVNITPKKINGSVFLLDKITDKTFSETMLGLTQKSLAAGANGTVSIDVASKQKKAAKENVIVAVNINYDALGKSAEDLTRQDQEVYNAICTFYESENYTFTLDSLYREITGNKAARLTDANREALRDTLRKFMSVLITIDNSQEAKAYNLPTMYTAEVNLCYMKALTEKAVINGAIVNEAYKIMEEPILLTYAKNRKQLATVNKKYLPKVRENEVTIRQYLIREIELMKGKAHRTNILSYKTIYEYEHIDKSNRKKTSTTRAKVKKVLDSMKETGYIQGYKERKKQNVIDSIEVILKENS